MKKRLATIIQGWLPKPALPNKNLSVKSEAPKTAGFQFNRRFWISLAVSYVLFVVLVVAPFLLGYLDSTLMVYGLVGIGWSAALMVMVHVLNGRPEVRKRIAYVVAGVWLGFAVGDLLGLVLFPQAFLAVGAWSFCLLITAAPTAGGLIGYWMQKRKFTHPAESLEDSIR
jgi:hypothetical protein